MSLIQEPAQRFRSFQSGHTALPRQQALLPACGGEHLLITVDTLNVDVHFSAADDAAGVGHKSLAVNLSDLAAMGAQARWTSLAMRLPDGLADSWLEGFSAGFDALAARHGVSLCAMDIRNGPLSVTIEALGTAPPRASLRRGGARPGERIFVSGTLGDAAYGLAQRLAGRPVDNDAQRFLRQRLDRPQPRLELGICLRQLATSAIDVSDGLCADLGHILQASSVGATLHAPRLPLSEALRACASAREALGCALSGGDDYELCFTVPPEHCAALFERTNALGIDITDIGEIDLEPGLRVVDEHGLAVQVAKVGYDHFSR